ncbi:helix-turn-helix domain-containing protein [Falsiroseomonas oryziterrae]|uniref:helix-turn-helix domain-containing protein n=1 Tax=Falsiroseomonas oryziterrae TaxID=2911368 RepID=UPI001F017539|nr:helix-turn-helix domain-containing protein [Roseomonas sp. NPKOSM-4]
MQGAAGAIIGSVVRTADHDHLGRVLQGARMEYMPHPGQPFHAALRALRMDGVTAQHVEIGACLNRGAIEPGIAAIVQPVRHDDGATSVNGIALGSRDALLLAGGAELVTAGSSRRSWVSVALPQAFLADLEELGPPPVRSSGSAAVLDIPDGPAAQLQAALLAAAEMAQTRPAELAAPGAAPSLAASLRELAAEAMTAGVALRAARRATREMLRVFRQSEDLLQANISRPIYRDDLCVALGVSRRKLHDAFAATVGMSPPAYLKLRRLVLVRRALRSDGEDAPLVKSVALSHGFWHLGHFARDYRQMFGELPSQTITAARPA